MNLNHDVTKVEDWEQKSIDNYGTREALVWGCLLCGIQSITEENAKDFARRLYIYERTCCPIRNACHVEDNGSPVYLTLGDVRQWIGMWTNATQYTDDHFMQKMIQYIEDYLNEDCSKPMRSALVKSGKIQKREKKRSRQ